MTKFSLVPQTVKVVKNEGSTARDHLANERTLLAWVRTAVALLALGLAIGESLSPCASSHEGSRPWCRCL